MPPSHQSPGNGSANDQRGRQQNAGDWQDHFVATDGATQGNSPSDSHDGGHHHDVPRSYESQNGRSHQGPADYAACAAYPGGYGPAPPAWLTPTVAAEILSLQYEHRPSYPMALYIEYSDERGLTHFVAPDSEVAEYADSHSSRNTVGAWSEESEYTPTAEDMSTTGHANDQLAYVGIGGHADGQYMTREVIREDTESEPGTRRRRPRFAENHHIGRLVRSEPPTRPSSTSSRHRRTPR